MIDRVVSDIQARLCKSGEICQTHTEFFMPMIFDELLTSFTKQTHLPKLIPSEQGR